MPARAAVLLALLPLLFTGKAVLRGELYGPSDLYAASDPWRAIAVAQGAPAPANPILSDLAFANLPWRAAVREAAANGRAPLWNRFVLGGNPLLGTAQAGVLHPATWLGLWLPLPLSFTFSCAFTLLLALLSAFLFFSDFRLGVAAALAGAIGWGFSTYVLFWLGWSVGPSTVTLPLLLLGLRRLARGPGRAAIGMTAAALWLSFCGGHPESFFHGVAAGGVYFLWELFPVRAAAARRAIAAALSAGALALLLAGPQLLPLLENIPHSAEYRARREALAKGGARQSVPPGEAVRRLLPDVLPFAHGIYGKSPVQTPRNDGSGMPLGYAGAVLFPLAFVGLRNRRERERGRSIFLAFALAGLAYGASTPGLHDLTARLPGFELALNYRLVFLAGLGLSGLAAFGVCRIAGGEGRLALLNASWVSVAVIVAVFLMSRGVLAERGLPDEFLHAQLFFEIFPIAGILVAVSLRLTGQRLAFAALVLLCAQRFLEMRGVYPTLPASSLAPPLPALAALRPGADPARIVAAGTIFRPNGSALYGLEDVRGYESLVLDRFADTYPLWCRAQPASFNLVTRLESPFLAFLNARYAVGAPGDPAPAGWLERSRDASMVIFENPRALSRAFVPRRLRREPDAARRLEEMAGEKDFSGTAWLSEASVGAAEEDNGDASLQIRALGPDLLLEADVARRVLVVTSLPDWPGWTALEGGNALPLATVNHAFVGFWLDPGRHAVRLTYRPASWILGLAAFTAGVLAAALAAATGRHRAP